MGEQRARSCVGKRVATWRAIDRVSRWLAIDNRVHSRWACERSAWKNSVAHAVHSTQVGQACLLDFCKWFGLGSKRNIPLSMRWVDLIFHGVWYIDMWDGMVLNREYFVKIRVGKVSLKVGSFHPSFIYVLLLQIYPRCSIL